jgi:hypothetical protein
VVSTLQSLQAVAAASAAVGARRVSVERLGSLVAGVAAWSAEVRGDQTGGAALLRAYVLF